MPLKSIWKFISYWYFRYLMVTELYMVERWERNVINSTALFLFCLFWYFNATYLMSGLSGARLFLNNFNALVSFSSDFFHKNVTAKSDQIFSSQDSNANENSNFLDKGHIDIKMPRSSIDDWSMSSTLSGRTGRSRKSLAEKIRELGFNFRSEQTFKTLPSYPITVKFEENRPMDYIIMKPSINLDQIVYIQPEIIYDENNPGKITYEFEEFRKKSTEARKISDIEVKSYKPMGTMVFRKKKKRSSIITTVEKILHQYRSPLPSRDVSEESIVIPKTEKPKPTINDLPESVFLKIFKYFNVQERNLVLAFVCKSWYYILNDPIFWIELKFTGSRISKEMIILLLKKHPSVRKLYLTAVPDIVDILQELCRCNHSITHLKISNCILSNQDFIRIILHVISCCTLLEIIDLEGMCFRSDRFFLELGRLKNLKSINLTGNKMLQSHNLVTLSVNCRNLQELKILDTFVNNEQNSLLKDADVIYIVMHLQKNLETLEMDMQKLKSVSYQAILSCTKLKTLILRNCLHLTSETFRQFSDLENLTKLEITRGINLKPEDFQHAFGNEKMRKIEDLDINGCWRVGEIGLQAITHSLTSLKSLSLKNCKTIEEHHLAHLSRCPRLTYLNISHTGIQLNSATYLLHNVRTLENLVIDFEMFKKSTIFKLKKLNPNLKIIMSFSEFQTDEKLIE